MIVDALTKVAAAQQVTADAASNNTFDSENVTPKRRLGAGEPLGIAVFITAVGTNTGSAKVQAIVSAATNLGTPTIVGQVDLAAGDLVAGKTLFVPISPGPAAAMLRYVGAYFDITGTVDFTVDAYIMPQSAYAQLAETYAKGYSIQ